MKNAVVLAGLLLLLLAGCAAEEKAKTMPSELPPDFQFLVTYGVGGKNQIDTFTMTLEKDLIADGTATAHPFTFSSEELQAIYSEMKRINLAEPKVLDAKTNCFKHPYVNYYLKVQYGGQTKEFSFSDHSCHLTADGEQLKALIDFIRKVAESKKEYQQLPEPKGGYM